jgi:hypothetical protein
MKQLTVKNKKICFSLTSPSDSVKHHVGEYFQVIENQPDHFFLYYKGVDNGKDVIKLAVSGPDFVFSDPRVIVSDSPGGSFCIVKNKDWFCMLCGSNISTGEDRDVDIPDLVWNETKKRSYPDHHRDDRKNGLYLLRSKDGIDWEEISPLPVMHSFLEGDGVPFGSVGFDTKPSLIRVDDGYLFYSRLNPSLDERAVFFSKSNYLSEWSKPSRINIFNEPDIDGKHNYYNLVIFNFDGKFCAFAPYFEACGTDKRKTTNGKTVFLVSDDGQNWEIRGECFPHQARYDKRVNSVIEKDDKFLVFFRENLLNCGSDISYYEIDKEDIREILV